MRVFFTFTVTVTLVVLSLISAPVEAGDSGVSRPGSYVVVVGGEVSVRLRASGITEPGVDAWVLDVAFGEDARRQQDRNGGANLGAVRRLAVSLLRQEKTIKRGAKCKRMACTLDPNYLLKVFHNAIIDA